jgi:hypothetical protein
MNDDRNGDRQPRLAPSMMWQIILIVGYAGACFYLASQIILGHIRPNALLLAFAIFTPILLMLIPEALRAPSLRTLWRRPRR